MSEVPHSLVRVIRRPSWDLFPLFFPFWESWRKQIGGWRLGSCENVDAWFPLGTVAQLVRAADS